MESISLESTEPAETENGKYGEKMKYEASGPYEKSRTKTDFCWLIGFIVYLIIWSVVIIYAFSVGDTSRWLKPKDGAGRVCGYDPGVENKPYLAQYNQDICYEDCSVCVATCPDKDFEFEFDVEQPSNDRKTNATAAENTIKASNGTDAEKQKQTPDGNVNSEESKKVDKDKSTASGSGNSEQPEKPKVDSNGTLEESGKPKTESSANSEESKKLQEGEIGNQSSQKSSPEQNAHYNGTSENSNKNSSVASTTTQHIHQSTIDPNESQKAKLHRMKMGIICKSDVDIRLIDNFKDLQYLVIRGMCSRTYKKADCSSNSTAANEEGLLYFIRDVSKTKFSILGFISLSGAIALAIVFLLRWYAMMYVCTSIFVICAMAFDLIYEYYVVQSDKDNKTDGVLLALFFGVVVTVLIVVIAIYFRQQISLACQMIKESSKAITCVLSSIAVPVIFFALYALILVLGVSVYFQLSSLESPVYRADFADKLNETCECPAKFGYSQGSTCDPEIFSGQCRRKPFNDECVISGCYMVRHKPTSVGFLHFLNFFGLVWSYGFISGYMNIVLASVFATWYWTFNKKILSYLCIVESFWRISTYHLGTIALGSLVLLVCKIIRTIVKGIERGLRKSKRPQAAIILLSLNCIFNALEQSVNFISESAYIMCAMHGTDFLQSARTAFYLLKRNITRVLAVTTVTSWLTFITTCLIVSITTRISISYYYSTYYKESSEGELYNNLTPILLVVLGSYAITCMLMRVVEVAVETVFLCFLEDIERNDGTNERPYFMSDELTKFLYKK